MAKIHELYSTKKTDKKRQGRDREVIYSIASIVDSYNETGRVYVNVCVCGKASSFQKSVAELYQKEWLNGFSKEDVAYIGFLYAAEEKKIFF